MEVLFHAGYLLQPKRVISHTANDTILLRRMPWRCSGPMQRTRSVQRRLLRERLMRLPGIGVESDGRKYIHNL